MSSARSELYRFAKIESGQANYRTEYRRDYARVLHSSSFRRLQNKTQLFPGYESDFFRNRLTHSLEVAQIAKTIAIRLKDEYALDINPDVCEIAGLMHDLGHPPFGHNGEAALDECMLQYGGFEGNAQTIRVITRLEKKECSKPLYDKHGNDSRVGLNLTARVIASALKYDSMIPLSRKDSALIKGYYTSEKPVIDKVKECLIGKLHGIEFKTIECSIMDLADDIAYSTYDIEDAFKAGFLTPYEMMSADHLLLEQIVEKMKKDHITTNARECRETLYSLFAEVWQGPIKQQKEIKPRLFEENTLANFLMSYELSKSIASDGYRRTKFTSYLVNRFINGVNIEINSSFPVLSKVYFDGETKLIVNLLKHFGYVALINSSRLKIVENRGKDIVKKIFDKIKEKEGYQLLPEDFQRLYREMTGDSGKNRLICDFIAGMTDRYALEFYGRLFSENPQTIFKPL